jgi:catechol 2,3-dioxygenase-like lactoylglutathione lyase family enzyme
MLHHVSLEIPIAEVERSLEFWEALGFVRVEAPGPINPYVSWLERSGTQVHLIHCEEPVVPVLGHAAIVAPEFDATVERLTGAGFEVEEHQPLWGERRSFATAPGGHKVELMEAPPPPNVPDTLA